MPPRGNRLACSVKAVDGAVGSFDVFPGEEENSVSRVEPIKWNKETAGIVSEGAFSLIGDLGMTGRVILVNQYQWRALADAKIEKFFYAAILWGKNPFKVVDDANPLLKRGK